MSPSVYLSSGENGHALNDKTLLEKASYGLFYTLPYTLAAQTLLEYNKQGTEVWISVWGTPQARRDR